MVPKRSLRMVVPVALMGIFVGCGSGDAEPAASSVATTTVPATVPTSVPATGTSTTVTPVAPTSAPPTSTDIVETTTTSTSTTTTTTSTTATTSTSTTVPTTGPPTEEIVLVFAGAGSDFVWQRIGIWTGTDWVDLNDDDPSVVPTDATLAVASVDLAGPIADVPYEIGDYACIDTPSHQGVRPDVTIPESPLGWGYQALAATATWPLHPRPVLAVGLDAPVYQSVGEQLLAGRPGIDPADGDVVQVLRADLDGDGTEEVLVSFRHLSEGGFGEYGDFSIVYLRRIGPDGTVVDEVVFEHIVPETYDFPPIGRGSVAAIADLNGDGIMEVAIRSAYWEWTRIDVYEMRSGELELVLVGGCGS